MEKNKEVLELVFKAKKGDKEAFNQLYIKYQRSILGYITSRCSNKEDAEDIAQMTWAEVFERIKEYDTEKCSFYRFVIHWAEIMRKRNYKKAKPERIKEEELKEEKRSEEVFDINEIEKLLRVTFSDGGPPHQLIAFGFNKLLSGWGPKKIVEKLSSLTLRKLCEKLIEEYRNESLLPIERIEEFFQSLKVRMENRVDEILDETSRKVYKEILKKRVGETTLKEYFGKDPEHNISDWSDKVKKRVFRIWKGRGYEKMRKEVNINSKEE